MFFWTLFGLPGLHKHSQTKRGIFPLLGWASWSWSPRGMCGFLCCFSFCLFRATPETHESSQVRGHIRAAAASLHHSSQQCWILNLVGEARDWTHIRLDTSHVCYHWATTGAPIFLFFGSVGREPGKDYWRRVGLGKCRYHLLVCGFFFFFLLFRATCADREVSRLGVESEMQLPACATAKAA